MRGQSFFTKDIDKIVFLSSLYSNPLAFLHAQQELLYKRHLRHFRTNDKISSSGLSKKNLSFYQKQQVTSEFRDKKTIAVINLGSGGDTKKLPAISVDVSYFDNPDIVASADKLPFPDKHFAVVRASHVLEHFRPDKIPKVLKEWRRVLHPSGVLYLAVPDARIVFAELIQNKTPKGKLAFSTKQTTSTLTQIYGLGYENFKTNPRWKHHLIFSWELLKLFLLEAGFSCIARYQANEDLAYYCGVDDDSQNHYSLLVKAANYKCPHVVSRSISQKAIKKIVMDDQRITASYIIPVYNEEKNLQVFFQSLQEQTNFVRSQREFIFVVNGCSDHSPQIIKDFIKRATLNCRLIKANKGIINALRAGIASRKYCGFVGKIDADTKIGLSALDLMEAYLKWNEKVQVTYAEPLPIDTMTVFNQAEHNPLLRSQRLYYHGRLSVYRSDPFCNLPFKLSGLLVEDIFFSFYFIYFWGFNSIAPTPHAFVFTKTIKNIHDLSLQIFRSRAEIDRVCKIFPPFRILDQALERELYPSIYSLLYKKAAEQKYLCTPKIWSRLESTK